MGVERTDAVAAFSEFGCEMLAASGREATLLPLAVNCRAYHPLRNGAAAREALGLNGRFVVGWTPTRYADLQLEPLVNAFARFSQGRPDVALCIDGRVPGIAKAALVTNALVLVAKALTPAAEAPAPVTEASAPATGAPAPATGALVPVAGAPAPATGALVPVAGAPAPAVGALANVGAECIKNAVASA